MLMPKSMSFQPSYMAVVMRLDNIGMTRRSGGMSGALGGGGMWEMGRHWLFMCRFANGGGFSVAIPTGEGSAFVASI